MIQSVLHFFGVGEKYPAKTFSYYLPAPPKRKNGYQEKEFDRIIEHLREKEFELIDIKVQAHTIEQHGGVWIFCTLRPLSESASSMEINIDYQEIAGLTPDNIEMDPDIIHES